MYQDRIVIPVALRAEILDRIHESHQGITKCRERARAAVWWPQIGKDMEDLIQKCSFCRENRPTHRLQPLSPVDSPECSWEN